MKRRNAIKRVGAVERVAACQRARSLLMLLLAMGWLLGALPARAQDAEDDGLGFDDDVGTDTEASAGSASDESSGSGHSERAHSDAPPPNPDLEPEPDAEPPSGSAKQGNHVRVLASLGAGVGTRSYLRPAKDGPQRLNDTAFPAVDVGLHVRFSPASQLSWEVLVRYQSSISFTAHEESSFALPNDVDVRAEHAELSIAPRLRLGDDPDSAALAFAVGLGVRSFWPDIDESITPAYSLIGPQLRVELVLPIASQLSVRLGPEAQWIVGIDSGLQAQGVGPQGGAVGAQAQIQLELGSVFAIELAYRESHAFASTTRGRTLFEDVERFATARLAGRL